MHQAVRAEDELAGLKLALLEAERILEAQTTAGLITGTALMNIANGLANEEVVAGGAAVALRGLHGNLKLHADQVFATIWKLRLLPKCWGKEVPGY